MPKTRAERIARLEGRRQRLNVAYLSDAELDALTVDVPAEYDEVIRSLSDAELDLLIAGGPGYDDLVTKCEELAHEFRERRNHDDAGNEN